MDRQKSPKDKQHAETSVDLLFERALNASLQRQADVAVSALRQVLQLDPYHAKARHLLAAELAQAGKIDDALVEFSTALELAPQLPLPRFQMGLLLITCGRIEDAMHVWAPLDSLGPQNVLNRFRLGMAMMIRSEFDQALTTLRAAIAENDDFPAINGEINIVVETILAQKDAEETKASADAAAPTDQHILVSSYLQTPTIH